MKVGHMVLRNFADEIIALTDDYDKLKAENAELRAGQGRWPEGDDSPAVEQVPRVISADQVRPEQIIAYWQEGVRPNPSGSVAHVRAVELEGEGGYRITDAEGRFDVLGDEDDDYTIVLLEDAPVKNVDTMPATWKENGENFTRPYHHAILSDGRVVSYEEAKHIKDGDTPPRLTIHALNVAPVGSVAIKSPASIFAPLRKVHSGKWVTVGDELTDTRPEWSAEDLIEYGWADATLHLGERGDDE